MWAVKADRKARMEKQEKIEQERQVNYFAKVPEYKTYGLLEQVDVMWQDREEELRAMAIQLRRRERERRHRMQEDDDSDDSAELYTTKSRYL